jgi:hypothetical protein
VRTDTRSTQLFNARKFIPILQLELVFVRTFFEVKSLLVQCLVSCLNEMGSTSIANGFKVWTSER